MAETHIESKVAGALKLARDLSTAEDMIIAAGSLYVVAEAREALGLANSTEHETFDPWASR